MHDITIADVSLFVIALCQIVKIVLKFKSLSPTRLIAGEIKSRDPATWESKTKTTDSRPWTDKIKK